MSLDLTTAELNRIMAKMATEIKSLKNDLNLERELVSALESDVRKLTWALQIAQDEAAVNAKLLANKTPALRIVDDLDCPVHYLPFGIETDEADECTKVGAK